MYNGQDALMFVMRDVTNAVRNESIKADFEHQYLTVKTM